MTLTVTLPSINSPYPGTVFKTDAALLAQRHHAAHFLRRGGWNRNKRLLGTGLIDDSAQVPDDFPNTGLSWIILPILDELSSRKPTTL